mgnify:CR=1 FL=1
MVAGASHSSHELGRPRVGRQELRDALLTPYTFFLFIPSTILPVFLELFKVNLAISDFILAVSCMQILFATRTIQEGKVLRSEFQTFVRVQKGGKSYIVYRDYVARPPATRAMTSTASCRRRRRITDRS